MHRMLAMLLFLAAVTSPAAAANRLGGGEEACATTYRHSRTAIQQCVESEKEAIRRDKGSNGALAGPLRGRQADPSISIEKKSQRSDAGASKREPRR